MPAFAAPHNNSTQTAALMFGTNPPSSFSSDSEMFFIFKPSCLTALPRDGDRSVSGDRRRRPVVPTQDCKVQFRQQGTTYVCSKSRNENLTRQNDPTLRCRLTAGTVSHLHGSVLGFQGRG